MKEFFKQMLSEEGTVSATRFIAVCGFLVLIPTVVIVWTYLSLVNKTMAEVPMTVTGLFGTMLAAKIWQKSMENK